jgi:hypothetical protein
MNDIIYEKVSKELGINKEIVERTHKAFWYYIRATISKLPLKESNDIDALKAQVISFNVPSLGKLYMNPYKHRQLDNNKKEEKNVKNKED